MLFIDINMPEKKGTDLVRGLAEKPLVIFTTAYKNYAVEGFELDAIDYLVKPISFDRFSKGVQKAMQYFQMAEMAQTESGSLFVRSEYQLVKIACRDILDIESVENYLKIYSTNGRPVMTLMTIKAVLNKLLQRNLPGYTGAILFRFQKLRVLSKRRITRINNAELPVSNSYIDLVKSWQW